ncbi:peptide deformylase [Streptomyces sp. NPDC056462]|uniref:peptide deformylase n=1 Tax=Streptomyces sp. NPDC056462 TaxID=3345826 RepID=UPI00368BDF5D
MPTGTRRSPDDRAAGADRAVRPPARRPPPTRPWSHSPEPAPASSEDADEQYEGCLSFFDVRGMVPHPLTITVETTALDGSTVTRVYERGLARLVAHEIDHLDGLLYPSVASLYRALAEADSRPLPPLRHRPSAARTAL